MAKKQISNKYIVEGLKKKPAFLLIFGICTLFSLSGIGTSINGIITNDSMFILWSVILLLISLTAALIAIKMENNVESRMSDIIKKNQSILIKYKNQEEAKSTIIESIEKSNSIDIFTMRGHSFILPERDFGFLSERREKKVRFCVADPKTKQHKNKHIINRAKEYKLSNVESYWNDILNDTLKMKEIIKTNDNFECKLHLQPATFRVFIFDTKVFFSFFKPYSSGSQLPIFCANSDSEIYIGFKRLFENVWIESSELKK